MTAKEKVEQGPEEGAHTLPPEGVNSEAGRTYQPLQQPPTRIDCKLAATSSTLLEKGNERFGVS